MKILDCTFRDGGYYTNWEFDGDIARKYLVACRSAGVDIIELGYKSVKERGVWGRCDDNQIAEILDKIPDNLCFMIDLADFSNNLDKLAAITKQAYNSPFSYCRIAIKPNEIHDEGFIAVYNLLHNYGYKIFINLMSSFSNETEVNRQYIKEFIQVTNALKLEGIYFADSYGGLLPEDFPLYADVFKQSIHSLGFHGHDNLGLAFASSLAAHNLGFEYIDGTMVGMGRGSGNTKTEQLSVFKYGYTSLSAPFIDTLSYFEKLREKYKFGFSLEYMVAGQERIHPLYVQWLNNSNITRSNRFKILTGLRQTLSYSGPTVEESAAVIIPARYSSSRFPGKPLAKILGKEMILWVAERAAQAVGQSNVFIATDDNRIVEVVTNAGFQAVITDSSRLTGTDRVAEAAANLDYDIFVNIQGDEPLIDPNDIRDIIKAKQDNPECVINCYSLLSNEEDANDTKLPMVVLGKNNRLLYMSRSNVPCNKQGGAGKYKQIGMYAFNKDELEIFKSDTKTPAEQEEDIEILRFLEKDIPVKMVETFSKCMSVDFPEDINNLEKIRIIQK